MARTRELRRRIRGITNTRKITHAMELVAATKMRRAAEAFLATRRYAELAWELLREVQRRADPTPSRRELRSFTGLRGAGVAQHPLLVGREPVRQSLVLVVAGNRGLVGAFNQRIVALVHRILRAEGVPTRVVTTGRVAARLLHRAGVDIAADFPKKDLLAEPADAAPIADFLLNAFRAEETDRIRMVYADFRSVVRQEPRVRTLLPVGDPDSLPGVVGGQAATDDTDRLRSVSGENDRGIGADRRKREDPPRQDPSPVGFLFEPSPQAVLESVVPNLLSIQIYQALLETTASEHAARMVAMKNATENADELKDDLTLTLNQARQQQITRELQEIVT